MRERIYEFKAVDKDTLEYMILERKELAEKLYKDRIIELAGGIDKKQIKFSKDVIDELYSFDNNKINKISARCGMGKSEVVQAFLYSLTYEEKGKRAFGAIKEIESEYGAIVITDKIDRLQKIKDYNGLKNKCYLMQFGDEDSKFRDHIKEQSQYPILLMSTQKYFRMSKEERNGIYSWKKGKRRVCIIDERPALITTTNIDSKFLAEIEIELDKIKESNRKDKNYLKDKFEVIRVNINKIRDEYCNLYEGTMWVKMDRKHLLNSDSEDQELFEILKNNTTYNIVEKFRLLKKFYNEGGLYINKNSANEDNTRNIVILSDNIDKFDTDKIKYHVFDATAKSDITYHINKSRFIDIKVDDTKDIKDMNLHYIKIGTGKNKIYKSKDLIRCISTWINTDFKDNECFVATYGKKSGIYQKFEKQIKQPLAYFGNIKGTNEYSNKNKMIHIGRNRQAPEVYLQTYILLKNKSLEWNNKMSNEEITEDIINIKEVTGGYFNDNLMDAIMQSQLLVDIEQNIFRIKCRHFSNKDICDIYMLLDNKVGFAGKVFNEMLLEKLAKKIGANFINKKNPKTLDDAITDMKVNNKNKEDYIVGTVKKYLDNLDKNTIIRKKDIISATGLKADQVDGALKSKWGKLFKEKHALLSKAGKANGKYII